MSKAKESLPRQGRKHRLAISLNDDELMALENYCKRYQTRHRSRACLVRELLLSQMIQRYEEDSPLLFSEDEMR